MLSLIVAIGENNEIGKNNELLWKISEDLKNFKKITTGKTVVMGSNTYKSIGRPLPKRNNIIVTRNKNLLSEEEINKKLLNYNDETKLKYINDFDTFLDNIKDYNKEIIFIGGASIYKQILDKNIVDKMYISHIKRKNNDADTFFPKINYDLWKLIKKVEYDDWDYCEYIKK